MELQSGEFADGSGLNMYEYKYRFYDHQIGRFISQDGLADKYPYYAPYQFAGNEPTRAIDLDGLEPAYFNQTGTDRFGLPTGYQTQSGDNLRRPISNQQSFTKSVGKPSTGDFKQAMIGMAGIAGIAALPFVAEAAPALWVSAAPEITALQGIEVGALGGAAAGGAMAASEGAGIRQNAAQGAAFEQEGVAGLKAAGNTGVVEQVTVKAANGVKVRLDALSIDVTGNIAATEFKSSATAPLTTNQKAGFPSIAQSGGVVVGKGKPGFEGGTKIPPTTVDIIRPTSKNQ